MPAQEALVLQSLNECCETWEEGSVAMRAASVAAGGSRKWLKFKLPKSSRGDSNPPAGSLLTSMPGESESLNRESVSSSVMSDSWRPHGLQPARLLYSRNSPSKIPDTGSPVLQADSLLSQPPRKPTNMPLLLKRSRNKPEEYEFSVDYLSFFLTWSFPLRVYEPILEVHDLTYKIA